MGKRENSIQKSRNSTINENIAVHSFIFYKLNEVYNFLGYFRAICFIKSFT